MKSNVELYICIRRRGVLASYSPLPFSTYFRGGAGATKTEKAEKRATVSRFINEAKVGNVYTSGAGMGDRGVQFEIVSYNRSPNKMGIRAVGSSRAVALTTANVTDWIKNGAKLRKRGKKPKRYQQMTLKSAKNK